MAKSLREQLIGAWKLISYEEKPLDGSPSFYPMSEQPMGIIMYTPDGYMSAQLSRPDRKPFASRDWFKASDEQADQLFAMTDPIAERVRKIGGTTLRSIGQIVSMQRVSDNDAEYVEPEDMLAELREDSKTLAARLREAHGVCEGHEDIATASLIEVWIDETERRTWFLFEASRHADSTGH